MNFFTRGFVFVLSILVSTSAVNVYAEEPASTFVLSFGEETQFSGNDIVEYCWETHTIKLSEEAIRRFDLRWPYPECMNSKIQPRGFSVKVDGEFVYSGSIPYVLSSYFPKTPVLNWPINMPGWTDVTIGTSVVTDLRESRRALSVIGSSKIFACFPKILQSLITAP